MEEERRRDGKRKGGGGGGGGGTPYDVIRTESSELSRILPRLAQGLFSNERTC